MTIATDLGFKIGELYRVVVDNRDGYLAYDMIVRFVEDDGSSYPWFEYVSGPKDYDTDSAEKIAINLQHLVPFKTFKSSEWSQCDCKGAINKSLLQLYIEQQYPDDKMLKALVEAL